MAQQTTKEILKLVEYQIEQIFTEVEKIKEDNRAAHDEVKENSNFRKETVKWRNALGFGVFSLIGKHIWDFIKGTQ